MDKFYKWVKDNDVYCARVMRGGTAHYYKKGVPYALYQRWLLRPTDVEITEEEFNKLLQNETNNKKD